jgi:hypothetical protein
VLQLGSFPINGNAQAGVRLLSSDSVPTISPSCACPMVKYGYDYRGQFAIA